MLTELEEALRQLNREAGMTFDEMHRFVDGIIDVEDAYDSTDDSHQAAGFMGEVKGLMKALKFLGAESESIIAACRAARRERENG